MNERLLKQIEFIAEIDKLKSIYRQSRLIDNSRQESDAEHSWHLAIMAVLLSEYANKKDLDLVKVIKMVLVHDLVEIDAGDTFCYDYAAHADKAEREQSAATRLFSILPEDQGKEFRALWDEFEERKSLESCFAAALDRLEPVLLNCRNLENSTWNRYGITMDKVVERNKYIEDGAKDLWEYAKSIIEEAML